MLCHAIAELQISTRILYVLTVLRCITLIQVPQAAAFNPIESLKHVVGSAEVRAASTKPVFQGFVWKNHSDIHSSMPFEVIHEQLQRHSSIKNNHLSFKRPPTSA